MPRLCFLLVLFCLGSTLGVRPAQAQFGGRGGFNSDPSGFQALTGWGKPRQPIPFLELAFEKPVWLVRARVIKTNDTPISGNGNRRPIYQPDELVVLQSYTGPDLAGRSLELEDDHGSNEQEYLANGTATPTYPVGQEVLLSISPQQPESLGEKPGDKITVDTRGHYGNYYGLNSVIAQSGNPWVTARFQYAAAIGRAYAASPQQLEATLRDYARGSDPNLAIWATRNLGFWINCGAPPHPYATPDPQVQVYPLRDRAASLAWLWKLTMDPKRPVMQQLTLDTLLHRLDAPHWDAAPQRMALLKRLCSRRFDNSQTYGTPDAFDATNTADYVQTANDRRLLGLSSTQLLSLFETLIDNSSINFYARADLIRLAQMDQKQGFTAAQWLAFCAQTLSPAQQCLFAYYIEDSLVRLGGLPVGSEVDSNLLITHWQAGLAKSSTEQQWNQVQHAIKTLQAMQAGVQLSYPPSIFPIHMYT